MKSTELLLCLPERMYNPDTNRKKHHIYPNCAKIYQLVGMYSPDVSVTKEKSRPVKLFQIEEYKRNMETRKCYFLFYFALLP